MSCNVIVIYFVNFIAIFSVMEPLTYSLVSGKKRLKFKKISFQETKNGFRKILTNQVR